MLLIREAETNIGGIAAKLVSNRHRVVFVEFTTSTLSGFVLRTVLLVTLALEFLAEDQR